MRSDARPSSTGPQAEAYLSREATSPARAEGEPSVDGSPPRANHTFFFQDGRSTFGLGRQHHQHQESHELHLRYHVTRDSMVDNLLCSFNELPDGKGPLPKLAPLRSTFYNNNDDDDKPRFAYDIIRQHREYYEHLRSASSESDYDLRPAEYFTPYQNRTTQIRGASGGSRPIKTPTGKQADYADEGRTSMSSPNARSTPRSRGHSRRQSSKDHANSVDRGRKSVENGTRAGRRRSTSFDLNVHERSKRQANSAVGTESILERRRPVPAEYHYFDAAPVPTVPFGQHRSSSPPRSSGHQFQSKAFMQPNSLVQSVEQNYVPQTSSRDKVATLAGSTAILAGKNNNNEYPAHYWLSGDDSQPFTLAPLNGTRAPTGDGSTRERQGFFRRVFGSAKAQSPSLEKQPPQLPPLGGPARVVPKSTKPSANASANTTRVEEPSPAPEEPPHPLNKKSSFFKRWKKHSGKDDTPVPQNPDIPANASGLRPNPSATSLREVMDPFLNDPTSPVQVFYDTKEWQSTDVDDGKYRFADESELPRSPISGPNTSSRIRAGKLGLQEGQSPLPSPKTEPRPRAEVKSFRKVQSASALVHRATANDSVESSPSQKSEKIVAPLPSSVRIVPSTEATQVREDFRSPSATSTLSQSDSVSIPDDSNFVVRPRTQAPHGIASAKPARLVVRPSVDESALVASLESRLLDPPTRQVSGSSIQRENYSSTQTAAIPQLDGECGTASVQVIVDGESLIQPTHEERARAQELFDGHDNPTVQANVGALLGKQDPAGERLRLAYMDLFDFSGLNILLALRDLCGRLVLRGETQQLDRILSSFSNRWCECNATHGFKSQDIVHTIAYSLLLLNTDLHTADLDQRMTRVQFVKNTLPTLRQFALEQGMESGGASTSSQALTTGVQRDVRSPSPFSPHTPDERPSLDTRGSESRLSARPNRRPISEVPSFASPSPYDGRAVDAANLLVEGPFEGTMKGWESQMEMVLREFYTSIRQLRLPLLTSSEGQATEDTSSNNLAPNSYALQRHGSVVNKMASDGRGRNIENRPANSRWSSKNRSVQRLYPTSTRGSSRTSFEETSLWSLSGSSTWSKSVFGKTQTTMSTDSLASRMTQGDFGYQQSIGFANALSHAIIREESANTLDPDDFTTNLLEDETLELAGAPWAKEGIVHHKHHLETTDRKAKDRHWNECFAVVEKGWVRLFSFTTKGSIRSQKSKPAKGAVVGGGNWTENAEALGTFMLRQTIANVLPSPGYSKARPHVFALSLPNGAVHLFQVGTPEIAKEFVSTANYWSARLSKEPLVGGVSNVEYGWSELVVSTAALNSDAAPKDRPPSAAVASLMNGPVHSPKGSTSHKRSLSSVRPSFQGSLRSSLDMPSSARPKLPGDKVALSEWSPPVQSLMASPLSEAEQLAALETYVRDVEEDLARHNELRPGLVLAFSPRHPNANKALANWERKSSYLLREIVKFRTYIDSLHAARAEHEKIKKEREERAAELAAVRAAAAQRKESADSGASSVAA